MKVRRFDQGEIRSAIRTPEGYLKVEAAVTRTGVFIYRNADGSLRRELRHPDDVFRLSSLRTMKMIPITNEHPQDVFVNADNSRKLSVGFTGQDIRPDGNLVIAPLQVTDSGAIDAVESGKQGLSLGYELMLIAEDGEYNGESYDYRQTDIAYNHLAIVSSPRAGDEARIHLDENDAEQVIEKKKNSDSQKPPSKEKKMDMVKINLDGLTYEGSPEVAKALDKVSKRADETETALKAEVKKSTTLQANLDEANEKIEAAKNVDTAEEIQKAVAARLALVGSVRPHLDEDTMKNIDGMSDLEIKSAVIKKHFPKANLDEQSNEYIQARFDSALEIEPKPEESGMGKQRRDAADTSKQGGSQNNSKRDEMVNANLDAWKGESK